MCEKCDVDKCGYCPYESETCIDCINGYYVNSKGVCRDCLDFNAF